MANVLIWTYGPSGSLTNVFFDTVTKAITKESSPLTTADGNPLPRPAEGEVVYSACDGTTLDRVIYTLSDDFTYSPEANSVSCPINPPDGTYIRDDCYGYDKYQVVADGNGGERQGALVEANSADCGYIPPPVYGCTDPDATNYDPNADTDDGTCTYPSPVFYPVGGVLPNPIKFPITINPKDGVVDKVNHFVKATVYRHSDNSVIGELKARVRNGVAVLDIAAYLRPLVRTEMETPADIVSVQEGAVVRFYLGWKELYGTTETSETLITVPAMYAVEAAMDGLNDTLDAYVLK